MLSRTFVPTASVVAALFAGAAQSNCALVADALTKAEREPRLAQYDVDGPDQRPTGTPMVVRIGNAVWAQGPSDGLERSEGGAGMVARMAAAIREKGRCEAPVSGVHRGAAVRRVKFTNPNVPAFMNPWVMSIGVASGLPVYHEFGGSGPGGIAWVYGADVVEPSVPKRRP